MTDPAFIDRSESLTRQNERLLKITASLIRRVERDTDETGNAYSLFQRAVALEGEVRARTQDLQRTLDELNRVNEKLEAATAVADEANRAKTRFLAAASHDVLQPLNAAKLFLGTLQSTSLDERQYRITNRLRTAFDSVESLLGALLDISKLDSAAVAAEISTLPIARILSPIATEFAPIAAAKGIDFRVVNSSALIESDPAHLRRVVQNLVSNAVRYCETGKVLVGCRLRGNSLRIEVHDTGPGIEPALIPEIFREFHRLDAATTNTDHGMGLGLAIVDRACRLLGHPIDISSKPSKGSLFSVTVPLRSNATDRPEAEEGARGGRPDSLQEMIALVLHPQTEARSRLVFALESWGASVIAVQDLKAAIQACDQLGIPPDMLLIGGDGGDPEHLTHAINEIRGVHGDNVPTVVLDTERQSLSVTQFDGLEDLSVANTEQIHRLRALLSWKRDHAKAHQ